METAGTAGQGASPLFVLAIFVSLSEAQVVASMLPQSSRQSSDDRA